MISDIALGFTLGFGTAVLIRLFGFRLFASILPLSYLYRHRCQLAIPIGFDLMVRCDLWRGHDGECYCRMTPDPAEDL